MTKSKLTLKTIMIYDYVRRKGGAKSTKTIFNENQDDIFKRFGIKSYAGFNRHVTKAVKWQAENDPFYKPDLESEVKNENNA